MRRTLPRRRFRHAISSLFLLGTCLLSHTPSIGAPPEYLQSFDPNRGFKPAQRDLTEVFLQLAGSLEYYGSPEPYLRHVAGEHHRIEERYRKKFGRQPSTFRPAYLDDEYIDALSKNWNFLSPKLGLTPYGKEVGRFMREAIKGTRGTGTIAVEIFDQHQEQVIQAISRRRMDSATFETLRDSLVRRLEIDKTTIDDAGYEVARRDAVRYAALIRAKTTDLFGKVEQALKAEDALRIRSFLVSAINDTGVMAESELKAGISEAAFENVSAASR